MGIYAMAIAGVIVMMVGFIWAYTHAKDNTSHNCNIGFCIFLAGFIMTAVPLYLKARNPPITGPRTVVETVIAVDDP